MINMASKAHLLKFSIQQIVKAFEKTKEQLIGLPQETTLVLVTDDMYDAVVRFLRDNYVPLEPISAALGLDKEIPDGDLMWRTWLEFNMSLAVKDNQTQNIVFVFVIGVAKYDEEPDFSIYKDDGFRSYLELIHHWERQANVFKYYDIKDVIVFEDGAVCASYMNQGVGSFMVKFAVQFVGNLGVIPVHITSVATSNFSKLCLEKNGFEVIYDLRYDEYLKDGCRVIPDTGIHKSMTVYGQRISATTETL